MKPLPDDAWSPWSPDELFARLVGIGPDWYVVGGWALDLWHGRQTRAHEDLEFAVPSSQTRHYRQVLSDLEFFAANDGKLCHLASTEPVPDDVWQLWGAELDAGFWRVDMMVDRGSPNLWVYKRDPSFALPRTEAIRATAHGIRYLAPAIVLLFKAKHARAKDHEDFRNALPRLDAQEKSDLCRWLELLHPGHVWAAQLQSS